MTTKKENPAGQRGQSEQGQNKSTNNSPIRKSAKALFASGKKLTAVELNSFTHSNDARKVISDLRREGWNIQDMRLPDGRKLYWLASPDRQLPLFPPVEPYTQLIVNGRDWSLTSGTGESKQGRIEIKGRNRRIFPRIITLICLHSVTEVEITGYKSGPIRNRLQEYCESNKIQLIWRG